MPILKSHNIFTQTDFDSFHEGVKNKRESRIGSVWIIKVNGDVYVTSSGKCGWKQKNHAKSAFKLDFNMLAYNLADKYKVTYYTHRNKLWNDFLSELERKGVIEFVEVC